MHSRIWSSTIVGIDAVPIEIETDIRSGLPRNRVVGLPYGAVCESLDRIWSALSNSGLSIPRGVITINLAPADLRKDSAGLDLPIALGMVAVSDVALRRPMPEKTLVIGELALDGSVRPVRGVLSAAIESVHRGFKSMIVPFENAAEAAAVRRVRVFGVSTLREAVDVMQGKGRQWRKAKSIPAALGSSEQAVRGGPEQRYGDLADIAGLHFAKRALEIAAAGWHNVLFVGPPGAGKTMLARRMPGLLPTLSFAEAVQVTRVYSARGLLTAPDGLMRDRPFRAPHHTISTVGLCGGGAHPVPGELSLAHRGVLFLDELPEFRRDALESLRQPLEEGCLRIGRARYSIEFPADVLLIGSMNPCPCGYMTSHDRECVCTSTAIQRYAGRVSGPLLDRIDLHVHVTPVAVGDLTAAEGKSGRTTADVRQDVHRARASQRARWRDRADAAFENGRLTASQVRSRCMPDRAARSILREASVRLGLTARSIVRTLKVARTIADLSGSDQVHSEHVAEAIQYRAVDRYGQPIEPVGVSQLSG